MSSFLPLLGAPVHEAQAASLPSWTEVFHLHDGPDYTNSNYYDWMNATGPGNPSNTNYESQTPPVDGISIRKNPSPNHKHFWVMYPSLGSDVTVIGDMSAHLWARSRGNQSGTQITAIFSDMAPGQMGSPNSWTNIGQVTVPLVGPTYSDFNEYDLNITGLSYTLAANHSLVLTVLRGDSFNDQLIVMFDTTAKDSYVAFTATSSISVDAAWTEDPSHNAASVFSDQENVLVEANVSDPFGAYDIVGANATVSYTGNGTIVPSPTNMSVIRTDPAQPPYWLRFELTLSPLKAGAFTINVTANDHQGVPTWFTCAITIVTVDHFGVTGPVRAVAGEPFTLTVTALDASNATITNWVGTAWLSTYLQDKTTSSSGSLSLASMVFAVADSGQVTNVSVNYSGGDETILIRASSGLHYGWSDPMHVSSGPVVSIGMNVASTMTLGAGSSLALVATGHDHLGNGNSTWVPSWTVTGSIGFISGSGTSVSFEARRTGVGNVTCTNGYNGVSSTINVTVTSGVLARIDIIVTFDPLQISEGETRTFNAIGYDNANNSLALTNVTWSTDTAGSIDEIGWGPSGLFVAGYLPESGFVRVRKGSIVGTIAITIRESVKGPSFSPIPQQYATENSGSWTLGLSSYWHHPNGTSNLVWWADNVDTSLFFISHDQLSNSVVVFHTQQYQFGDSTFELWAADPWGFEAFITVTVHIIHVNQPPRFVNSPPTTLYVKFATPYIFDFSYYVTDIDNAKLDLRLKSTSSNIFFDGLNATFMFPHKSGDASYFELVTLNLTDGTGSAELRVVVWVTTDTPPSLSRDLPDVTIDEGTVNYRAFNLDDYFTDIDNDTLYFSYGFHNVRVVISPTHDVFLSAPGEWSGTEEGVFTASDPTGALKNDLIHVTVVPVNDPPQVIQDLSTVVVRYNQTYYLYLSPFIFDPDNSLSSLTFNISDPHVKEGISPTGAPRLEMTFPPDETAGVYVFTDSYTVQVNMTITDPQGASVACTFHVRVTNDAPPEVAVQNPDQLYYSFPENSYLNGSLRLYDLFTDPDDSTLTFFVSGGVNVIYRLFGNGVVNLSSVVNWSGAETLSVRAFDSHGGWSLLQLFVVVTPVNQGPVIYPIPNFINRGTSYRNAHYPIFQYIYDSDDSFSNLTFTVTPAANAFVAGGDLYISLPEGVKVITVTMQVSDGKLYSNIVSFKVGVSATMAEKIGWPYSFPLLLLGVGIAAFFAAGRIPRPYELENLFLIHNDGRLVSNVAKEEEDSKLDKDVVSAMFTAVQEFVRDSFQKGEVGLKKLEIGEKNVVIEKGHTAYLALIYSGWPSKETFSNLHMLMSDVEERYKDRLEKWNGTGRTVGGVERMLQDYMTGKFEPGMWHEEEELAEKEWVDILDKES